MKKKTTLLNLLILIPAFVFCQDISNTNGKIPLLTSPQLQNNDPFQPDTNGLVDVIIEFKDLPMLNYLKSNKGLKSVSLSVKSLENRYKNNSLQFIKELKRLKAQTGSDSYQPQIKKSFHKVFNGISIEVPASLIPLLKSSPLVKKVYPNCKIELTEITPGSFTGSDKINQIYNNEGDSIIIAIIDTGIDYTHPALGGGFGPGYKVIGGYDFINKDNDPMDDCGHGTLCAGLIVGNSDQFRGIAPKASLLAFKVSGCHSGWTTFASFADITEAVEHCVDLKNTGDYTNNADIVSISLGTGNGSDPTNNPLCTAIDNASELGVTFCVSSSNNSGFYSIGSPGTAESAITVSACSYNNQIADFNSNGPSITNFTIKPDILAPGVNVKTTSIGGNYEFANGTSISCPIVAGIAALIKKAHPEWGPEEIKSAIVNTANDLNENVMKQGGGIVDAVKAYSTNTTISPSNLSFGFIDKTVGIWEKEISMTIWNHGLSSQQYKLKITNETPGLTITPSKESITLSEQSKNTITFTLAIDNNILPTLREDPYCYYGQLYLEGNIDTLHIPWAIAKSSKLVINSNENFSFILTNDSIEKFQSTKNYGYTQEIVAPTGIYDLVAYSYYHNDKGCVWFVIKENIPISGMDTIYLDRSDAKHLIPINGITEKGDLLHDQPNYRLNISLKTPFDFCEYYYLFQGFGQLSTSDFSDRYTFLLEEIQSDINNERKIRLVSHSLTGYHEGVNLTNSINDFKMQNIHLSIPSKAIEPIVSIGSILSYPDEEIGKYIGWGSGSGERLPSVNWEGQFYQAQKRLTKYASDLFLKVTDMSNNLDYLATGPFYTYNNRFRTANHEFIDAADEDYFSPDSGIVNLGICPIYPNIQFINNSSQMTLLNCPPPTFKSALYDSRNYDYYYSNYTLKKENTIINSGIMHDLTSFTLTPGLNTLEIKNNFYHINCIGGMATAVYQFNIDNSSDGTPPVITSMQIRNSKGIPEDQLIFGEESTLRVTMMEGTKFQAFIRCNQTETWQKMKIEETIEIKKTHNWEKGTPHSTSLMSLAPYITSDSTAWDIRVVMSDEQNNSLDYTLEPAFVVGNIGKEEAPIGDTIQQFCSGATTANLLAKGNNIKWYGAESGGSLLADTTLLVDGNYYFASQTGMSCESYTRLKVRVNILNILGYNEFGTAIYSVYPNPVTNQINLVVEDNLLGSDFTLFDSTGKKITSETINNEITVIDMKNLLPGMYFLRVNNSTHAEKIVKY